MHGALTLLLDPSINAKAWYLWSYASLVFVGPFLNIFFQAAGLTSVQVGVISALRPWAAAASKFIIPALADRLHAHRAVLLGTFTAAVGMRMLLLLPRSFSGLLAVVLAVDILRSPASVLADTQVMQLISKDADYGKYRLWGAVGWGTFSTVAGWLITHLGIRWSMLTQALLTLPCLFHGARLYSHSKPGQAGVRCDAPPRPNDIITTAAMETEPLLPAQEDACAQSDKSHRTMTGEGRGSANCRAATGGNRKEHDAGAGPSEGGPEGEQNYWRRLWRLARRGDVLAFFATVTAMGYGYGVVNSFLFLHLKQLGASETLMGLALTLNCASEVPAFQLQNRLVEQWGVTWVLDLVQVVYAIRLALYAVLPYTGSVLWVLPVELLHGITFACSKGTSTMKCKSLAPPDLAATLQGAYESLNQVGIALGCVVGGWVGSRLGWQGMYAYASGTMLAFWLMGAAARNISASRQPLKKSL